VDLWLGHPFRSGQRRHSFQRAISPDESDTMTAKQKAEKSDRSLYVLLAVLIGTNAWFLPHIFSHMG